NAWMDDRVGADSDVAVDVGRRRILDGDAGRHQLGILPLSHDSAHFRQLRPAVDSANFIGVRDFQRLDFSSLTAINGNQVGKVILALGILGSDSSNRYEQTLERERIDPRVDLTNLSFR